MAILTQRLIILAILINIVVGFVSTIMYTPTTATQGFETLENETSIYKQAHEDMNSTDMKSMPGDGTSYEPSFGNKVKMGGMIWGIFWRGMLPLTSMPWKGDVTEQVFKWGVEMFRIIFDLLLVIEIYLFIVNRKAT